MTTPCMFCIAKFDTLYFCCLPKVVLAGPVFVLAISGFINIVIIVVPTT